MGPEHGSKRGRGTQRGRCRTRRRDRRRPLPERECLRKGCGRRFRPRRGKQVYCGDADCLREVRRWQARKRQRRWRRRQEVKTKRRIAEKARRDRRRARGERRVRGDAGAARARGPICDRPGCFDPPAPAVRTQARYCGAGCRRDMQRARDRQRKWRFRLTKRRRAERLRRAAPGRTSAPAARVRRPRRGVHGTGVGSASPRATASSPIDPRVDARYASPGTSGRRACGRDEEQTIAPDRPETGADAPDGGDAVRLDGRARPP